MTDETAAGVNERDPDERDDELEADTGATETADAGAEAAEGVDEEGGEK